MRKTLDDEQFNYMIDFSLRQLEYVYRENGHRIPIGRLRLRIQERVKRLHKMKKSDS